MAAAGAETVCSEGDWWRPAGPSGRGGRLALRGGEALETDAWEANTCEGAADAEASDEEIASSMPGCCDGVLGAS